MLTPEDGGAYLAIRAASRRWERSSWQSHYGLTPQAWLSLREAVREALAQGPLTRAELAAAVTAKPTLSHLGFAFADGSDTMLKPLNWQGDMSFGPSREGQATFQSLADNPRWAGLPDLDEAGRRAIETYVRSYGPATTENVQHWLGDGLGAGRKRIQSWMTGLGDRLSTVNAVGETAHILSEDLEELLATPRTQQCGCLRPTTSGSWVRAPPTPTSCRRPRERRSAGARTS